MILTIDRGNSKEKFAVWCENKIIEHGTCEVLDRDLLRTLTDKYDLTEIAFVSVKSKENDEKFVDLLQEFKGVGLYKFEREDRLPFVNSYKDRQSVGLDRLACIAGAYTLFGPNILVVDAGTCITYDYLSANKEYRGGSISLGFQTKYRALHNFTANLPLLSSIKPVSLCCNTTKECMISGVVNGTLFEVEKTIEQYRKAYEGVKIVITGGDAEFIHENIALKTEVEENIIFYGLKTILELNEKQI